MKQDVSHDDRRCSGRIEFLRPIVYVHQNSDQFVEGTMLNHSSGGICFHCAPELLPGTKIYIMTEDAPIDVFCAEPGEAFFSEVIWCRQKAGAHRVGVRYINNGISYGFSPFQFHGF